MRKCNDLQVVGNDDTKLLYATSQTSYPNKNS